MIPFESKAEAVGYYVLIFVVFYLIELGGFLLFLPVLLFRWSYTPSEALWLLPYGVPGAVLAVLGEMLFRKRYRGLDWVKLRSMGGLSKEERAKKILAQLEEDETD